MKTLKFVAIATFVGALITGSAFAATSQLHNSPNKSTPSHGQVLKMSSTKAVVSKGNKTAFVMFKGTKLMKGSALPSNIKVNKKGIAKFKGKTLIVKNGIITQIKG